MYFEVYYGMKKKDIDNLVDRFTYLQENLRNNYSIFKVKNSSIENILEYGDEIIEVINQLGDDIYEQDVFNFQNACRVMEELICQTRIKDTMSQ